MSSDIVQAPEDIRVWKIFEYCQARFGKAGINIAFPKDTNPKKTYKWRYLSRFAAKLDEMEISNEAANQLIDAVIRYAVKHKQLHKGLSLLVSDKILMGCCDTIAEGYKSEYKVLGMIRRNYELVRNENPSGRKQPRSLPNIVRWYMEGKLSELYLSLSKRCYVAMVSLNKMERSMLPNSKQLILARTDVLGNQKLKKDIKTIIANDWRGIFD